AFLETFEGFVNQLDSIKRDFEGLRMMEEHPEITSEEEKRELFRLFGQEGNVARSDYKLTECQQRYAYWYIESQQGISLRRGLAEIVMTQYSAILANLN
ncbi:MAG: hypothetical protein Q4D38_15010, partial [Planctomycetia bacterium]|nr:hypothetical protein [Planctomycetia bacterium]